MFPSRARKWWKPGTRTCPNALSNVIRVPGHADVSFRVPGRKSFNELVNVSFIYCTKLTREHVLVC
jgi:hypothetical protein